MCTSKGPLAKLLGIACRINTSGLLNYVYNAQNGVLWTTLLISYCSTFLSLFLKRLETSANFFLSFLRAIVVTYTHLPVLEKMPHFQFFS